jgi:hypothetical protein
MRVRSRLLDDLVHTIGFVALTLFVLLASPGVRATQAEEAFSHDPALEASAATHDPALEASAATHDPALEASAATVPPEAEGPACAAREAGPRLPLRGLPFLLAQGDPRAEAAGLNSLNGRGYNIGKTEPAAELRKLEIEVLRGSR